MPGMPIDPSLQQQVLQLLSLTDGSTAEQAAVLQQVLDIAGQRLARLVPELLTGDQLAAVEQLLDAGANDDDVAAWVRAQLPAYDDLAQAMVLDVAEEAMSGLRRPGPS